MLKDKIFLKKSTWKTFNSYSEENWNVLEGNKIKHNKIK